MYFMTMTVPCRKASFVIYIYICWGEWHVVAWQVSEIMKGSDIMFVGGGDGSGEGEMAIGQTGKVAHSLHECVICFV